MFNATSLVEASELVRRHSWVAQLLDEHCCYSKKHLLIEAACHRGFLTVHPSSQQSMKVSRGHSHTWQLQDTVLPGWQGCSSALVCTPDIDDVVGNSL